MFDVKICRIPTSLRNTDWVKWLHHKGKIINDPFSRNLYGLKSFSVWPDWAIFKGLGVSLSKTAQKFCNFFDYCDKSHFLSETSFYYFLSNNLGNISCVLFDHLVTLVLLTNHALWPLWGHQCSWTLTLAYSMPVSIPQSFDIELQSFFRTWKALRNWPWSNFQFVLEHLLGTERAGEGPGCHLNPHAETKQEQDRKWRVIVQASGQTMHKLLPKSWNGRR